MISAKLHEPGERLSVRWPDGPHDYLIEFKDAIPFGPGAGSRPGWFLICGTVVEPSGPMKGRQQTFYVHPAPGYSTVYELTPFRKRS